MHEAVTTTEQSAHAADVARFRSSEAAKIREARAQHQEGTRDIKAQTRAANEAQARAHEATVTTAKEAHAAQVRAFEKSGASTIMDAVKSQVPALAGLPSNERGLLDAVFGKGQRLVSAKFDETMKDIIAAARGRTAEIRVGDANALGLRRWNQRAQKDQRGIDLVSVDASQLAERLLGVWKRDPGLYHRGVRELDRIGLGDPVARGEYKAFQALVQFADKSGMLRGQRFNPEKALEGFTKLKTEDELRRRGAGDIFQGPIAEAARRGQPAPFQAPAAPAPIPEPRIPAFRRPPPGTPPEAPPARIAPAPAKAEGVTTKKLPEMSFAEGAITTEIPLLMYGVLSGHYAHAGYGQPAVLAGGIAARRLSGREFATKAPLSPATQRAVDLLPPALAQEASSLARGPRPQPLTLTPGGAAPETQRIADEEYARTRSERTEDRSQP